MAIICFTRIERASRRDGFLFFCAIINLLFNYGEYTSAPSDFPWKERGLTRANPLEQLFLFQVGLNGLSNVTRQAGYRL
jgi:hypothetical protein